MMDLQNLPAMQQQKVIQRTLNLNNLTNMHYEAKAVVIKMLGTSLSQRGTDVENLTMIRTLNNIVIITLPDIMRSCD